MAPDPTFTIGELARRSGLTPDALRYYERLGVMTSVRRTTGGFRLYTRESLERVRFIKLAQRHGFTLAEVRELLRVDTRRDVGQCQAVEKLLERKVTELDARLMELQAFRRTLDAYRAQCARTRRDAPGAGCPVVEDLRRSAT